MFLSETFSLYQLMSNVIYCMNHDGCYFMKIQRTGLQFGKCKILEKCHRWLSDDYSKVTVKLNLNMVINPLSANPTKWSNTLKQFVCKLPMNCLSVFDHFVGLALEGLSHLEKKSNSFISTSKAGLALSWTAIMCVISFCFSCSSSLASIK